MGYLLFLKLCLKCIDLLAWPLLALGYPLCASIQAIENDSYSDTKNLISYWILLSLLYLFECAFLELLEWFLLWPYFKLTIIFWLVIPDFRRSFLVYRRFVHPCISMNPRRVISRIENQKKSFFEKENVLLQVEEYIKENGTEALEKLISSENMACSIEEEAVKAVPATEKKQMEQNLMHSHDAEACKDVLSIEKKQLQETSGKSLKVTEKKEVFADKNANPTAPNLALNESKSSGAVDAHRMAVKDHIEHRCIKVVEKKEVHADKNANHTVRNLSLNENKSSGVVDANRMAGKDVEGGELPHGSASKKKQKEWTCAICQVTASSEKNLNEHLHGSKHKAACEALKRKAKIRQVNKEQKIPQISIATQPGGKTEKIILTDAAKQRAVKGPQNRGKGDQNSLHAAANKTEQLNAKNVNGEFNKMKGQRKNMGKPVGVNDPALRCNLCNVVCTSEGDMVSHLNGRKHLDRVKSSSGA